MTLKPRRVRNSTRRVSKAEESSHEQIKKIKKMVIFFFVSRVLIHKEFVTSGDTVNQKYYPEVLDRLRRRVKRVRMETADDWILRAS
jgi:IS4 transposase